MINDCLKEILAMARLSKHQELFVHLYGWYKNLDTYFLAMEYFPHGDLQGCINSNELTEDDVKPITSQLLEGLSIMHKNKFTHRDLKPQNIFVVSKSPNWWVKIGDFGVTKRIIEKDLTALRTQVGTRHFQAPEILEDIEDHESSEYTNAVDMWSLGCVMYALLTQTVPFTKQNHLRMYCKGRLPFPVEPLSSRGVSSGAVELIKKLTKPHPSARLIAETALKDPWLEVLDTSKQALRQLQEAGFDISASNFKPEKALFWGAGVGSKEVTKVLLELNGVFADCKDDGGYTALMLAAQHGHEEVVKLLVDREDVTADSKTEDGWTPLSLAARHGHEGVVKLLLDRDDVAADSQDKDGWTPLMCAARNRHEGVVKMLLDRDDVAASSRNRYGWTALMYVAADGHAGLVKLLLDRYDVAADSKTVDGWTPLSLAARHGHEGVVKLLLDRDDVAADSKSRSGWTPLSLAAAKGHEGVVNLLKSRIEVGPVSKAQNSREHIETALASKAQNSREHIETASASKAQKSRRGKAFLKKMSNLFK
ncbi:MAG: Ankyrin repeat domain-containing protein 50 [Peltula sp. TS41687]|nr:MAG: Ankyrin repeat domain-containing protein 50 [Peltula sp. TS41687]